MAKRKRFKITEVKQTDIIRVGDIFFKRIEKVKADGTVYKEWSKILRQTIVDDFGKSHISNVKKFDSWCV